MESDREQQRLAHRHERPRRRKGEINILVQLTRCEYGRERQCIHKKAPCSTGFVIDMAGVFYMLYEWLIPASYEQTQEWSVLTTDWRGLLGAVMSTNFSRRRTPHLGTLWPPIWHRDLHHMLVKAHISMFSLWNMVNNMLANALTLEGISIPVSSEFFGHGFMQTACPGWRKTHYLQYHICRIPVQNFLKDEITFAFGKIFSLRPILNQKVTAYCSV